MALASLRVRLTAWFGGMLMCTLVVLGGAMYALLARAMMERIDAMLDFEFREAAERLAVGPLAEDPLDAPATFHETYLFRVLDDAGRILSQSRALAGHALPAVAEGVPAHSAARIEGLGTLRVVSGAVATREGQRIIQIAVSLEAYEQELVEVRGALATIVPVGLAAAVLGGYWIAGRSLAPVARMTETARRISASNLGDRIEVGTGRDELGRLGATINAMLDRIDRAFAASRRFTADAAHELKTPVASIRAEAEVALLSPRDPEEYRDTLRSVVEEAERVARLVDRLLLLAREDAESIPTRRPVRLDRIVENAVDAAREPARLAGLELRFEPPPPVEVEGDPDLLRQVFDNLLDNAVKYTPAGGTVTARGTVADGLAIVEVIDTGVGIPADVLPRVFDRFFRVDPSRSRLTGGTGLGLSIVRAVVERHGGSVEATSGANAGATFRVSIPIKADMSKI